MEGNFPTSGKLCPLLFTILHFNSVHIIQNYLKKNFFPDLPATDILLIYISSKRLSLISWQKTKMVVLRQPSENNLMVVLSHKLLCNLLKHTEGYIYILCVCTHIHINTSPTQRDWSNAFMQSDGKNALVPHAKLWCTDGGNAIKKSYVFYL